MGLTFGYRLDVIKMCSVWLSMRSGVMRKQLVGHLLEEVAATLRLFLSLFLFLFVFLIRT